MEQLQGKWELVLPKTNATTELLEFHENRTYLHQLVNFDKSVLESYHGHFELVPKHNELTELILVPDEEQPIIQPQTHLYLHTNYFIKKLGNDLFLLDYPGKSEEYQFKRV